MKDSAAFKCSAIRGAAATLPVTLALTAFAEASSGGADVLMKLGDVLKEKLTVYKKGKRLLVQKSH